MAKIQFRLRDENKKALAVASLVMSCQFKNGEKWKSERLTSDSAGVIRLEIPNNLARRISWKTATLDIRKGGKKLEYSRSEPEQMGRGSVRIEVNVKSPVVITEPAPNTVPDRTPKPPTQPPLKDKVTLIGSLITEDRIPVDAATVSLFWKADNGELVKLGSRQTDQEGEFTLVVDKKKAAAVDGTRLVPRIHKNGNPYNIVRKEPPREIDNGIWQMTLMVSAKQRRDSVVPQPDVEPNAPSVGGDDGHPYLVTGHILQPDGKPVAGKIVIAYDRGVCEENILGKNQSRKDGFYEIAYSQKNFVDPEKVQADLIVRVFKTDNDKEPLASSDLIVRAANHEIVDLSIGDEKFRGKSLYERVDNRLTPLMEDKEWDCIENQDLFLLVDRTGIDIHTIAQFVKSQRMAQTFQIPSSNNLSVLFFALLRRGLSPHLGTFLSKPDHFLSQVLDRASKDNWIPSVNIGQMLNQIRKPRATFLLQDKQNASSVFKLARLNNQQSESALEFLFKEKHIDESSWNRLAKKPGFDNDLVQKLEDTVQAVNLLGGNNDLMAAVKKTQRIQTPTGLARLTTKDWQTIITKEKVPVPDTVPGKTAAEKKASYARSLTETVEAVYPTAVFSQRWIQDGKTPNDGVNSFFKKNPDFEFENETVAERLSRNGGIPDAQVGNLKRVESLYHLSGTFNKFDTVNALWQSDISNALDVIRSGRKNFRTDFSKSLGGVAQADKVFNNAQHTVAYNLAQQTQFNPQLNGVSLNIMSSIAEQLEKNQQLKSGYEQLYGPYSLAHCEHCQSALSPAAYLVDLLSFLDRATSNGSTGREALQLRRPEIELIELDCANTDTIIPYIDLVLEVLENAIAPQPSFAPQTNLDSLTVAAEPENENPAAYAELKNKDYPWILPFDLDLEQSRAYLKQAGVPRHELLLYCRQFNDLGQAVLSTAEYLGLSPKHSAIVSLPAKRVKLAGYWGFQKLLDLIGANTVESAMAKSNLSYEELSILLNSNYVNPDQIDLFTDTGSFKNLDIDILDRAHRMGRLFHLTNYSIEDLDLMLAIVFDGPLRLIPELASVAYLNQEAKIPFADIADWWSEPEEGRIHLFADSIGLGDDEADKLDQMSQLPWNTPVTPKILWDQLEILNSSGLSIEDAYYLLSPVSESSPYSEETINGYLEQVSEALGLLSAEEAVELTDGSSATSDVTLELADGSQVTVSQARAKQMETVEQNLASALGLEQLLVSELLSGTQNNVPITIDTLIDDPNNPSVVEELALFAKQAKLLSALGLGAGQLDAIITVASETGILNPAELPIFNPKTFALAPLIHLIEYSDVNNQWFVDGNSVFKELSNFIDAGTAYNQFSSQLATVTEWEETDLDFLFDAQGFNWGSEKNFLIHHGAVEIGRVIALAEKMGAPVETTWSYTDPLKSSEIKNTLATNYSDEKWLEVSAQIHDELREKQRDALLAWLIEYYEVAGKDTFHNSLDVYGHFLLDPDMSACFDTSRIVQATASVQQLIQRILLVLEGDLAFSSSDQKEWEWRKNYRVWEANLKVFIYPENWIEPEFRDNKTEQFMELESQLLQDEVTEKTAERALLDYTKKLHEVSNLETAAIHEDKKTQTLYLFSRTRGLPHKYFMCFKKEPGEWTGWQRINLDIEGNHLLPVVFNRQLYLFWPVFEEKEDENEHRYLTINLAWSHFDGNGWAPAKLSTFTLNEDAASKESIEESNYHFVSSLVSSGGFQLPKIDVYVSHHIYTTSMNIDLATGIGSSFVRVTDPFGEFYLDICNEKVVESLSEIKYFASFPTDEVTVSLSHKYNMKQTIYKFSLPFSLMESYQGFIVNGVDTSSEVEVDLLGNYRGDTASILFPSHGLPTRVGSPFIFEDDRSIYLVTKDAVGNSSNGVSVKSDSPISNKYSKWHGDFFLDEALIQDGKIQDNFTLGSTELYTFTTFYHPYSCAYIKQLSKYGIEGLYKPDKDIGGTPEDLYLQQTVNSNFVFNEQNTYDPFPSVNSGNYPDESIEMRFGYPYSVYNREMFFHAPILIATRLMQNQQFEEARNWLHYVFDPTNTEEEGAARIWRFRPFVTAQNQLNSGDINIFFGNPENFAAQVAEWEKNPFNPHAIARFRTVAYMRFVIMRYLDNLIAWGDHLFRQDSRESINEAAQLYVLAAQILGPKPVLLEGIEPEQVNTVADILDGNSTTLLPVPISQEIENLIGDEGAINFLSNLLNFCIPQNDKLLGYWDTVADRLFKIRHCMNIEGIVRELALFEPPIDPALLVKAAAAGISIQSVVSSATGVGRPCYRFTYMLNRAYDFLAEVKSLGNTLLSSLEKKDAEELAAIRSSNEVELLKNIEEHRKITVDEAKESLEAAEKSLETTTVRRDYYAGLIKAGLLDQESEQTFQDVMSQGLTMVSNEYEMMSSVVAAIPDTSVGLNAGTTFGGSHMSNIYRSVAGAFGMFATYHGINARLAGVSADRIRRSAEWDFQLEAAETEIEQLEKQVIAAEIRVAIAEKDRENQQIQVGQSEQVDTFLKSKYTNTELYNWISQQLSGLYFEAYQLAYDLAKKAELAYAHDLGIKDVVFIQFGHWDSLRKGLLAGERLTLDLRRMEESYIANNKRDLELTKHISLARINPSALLKLKNTGECLISISEFLFDLDYPGHYFRRIKNVSLTIPALTGPYSTLGCTLTLKDSKIRRAISDPDLEDLTSLAGQRIATSSAQSDTGLFQLDFRDERYLPFEGEGAISDWSLRLSPVELAQFDYNTISDVVIHLSYQAKSGEDQIDPDTGKNYRQVTTDSLIQSANSFADSFGVLPLMVSFNQQWPDEWNKLVAGSDDNEDGAVFKIRMKNNLFPFFVRDRINNIVGADFFFAVNEENSSAFGGLICSLNSLNSGDKPPKSSIDQGILETDSNTKLLVASFVEMEFSAGDWELDLPEGLFPLSEKGIEDIICVLHYKLDDVGHEPPQ